MKLNQKEKDIGIATSMCRSIQSAKSEDVKKLAEFLVAKTASYPDFIEEIVAASPNISYEWLILVRKIGYGHFYAPLLTFYQTPAVRRVCRFTLAQQKELWKNGVHVVVPTGNSYTEKIKSLCNLSHKETIRAFTVGQTRSVPQQLELLAKAKQFKPKKKYVIRGDNVAMTRCVLSADEVAELASKVLKRIDLVEMLATVSKKAA
jgi:hypothetical protein